MTRDLEPPGAVSELLAELDPGRVISCVALARVSDCEERPEEAARLNAGLAGEAARWCKEQGARFVHVSTDLVFGSAEPREGGFEESDEPAPLSEYGRSKLAGERAVLEAFSSGARSGEPSGGTVVRLPLLYGNSAGRGLGASDSLLDVVAKDQRPPLFEDEWRTPLEVSNAADALVELAYLDPEGGADGLLHLAGPDRVSRLELGIRVLEAAGLDPAQAREEVRAVPSSSVPTVGARPRDVSLNAARACKLLETRLLGVARGTERAMS